MSEQKLFDFDGATHKAVVAHRKKLKDEMWRADLTKAQLSFIRCLESDYGCWHEGKRTSMLEMGKWSGFSEREMYRAKKELEDLLVIHSTRHHDGFHIVVTWGNLDRLVVLGKEEYIRQLNEGCFSDFKESPKGVERCSCPDTVAESSDSVSESSDSVAELSATVAETLYISSYPPTPSTPKARTVEEEGMKNLFLDLEQLGVELPKPAVQKAICDGCTIAEIEAIIAHYKKHIGRNSSGKPIQAWGPGALQKRIKLAHPGQAVDRGWDEPHESWTKHHTNLKHQRREADRAIQREIDKKLETQRKEQAAAELESDFGAMLDEMLESDLRIILYEDGAGKQILKFNRGNIDRQSRDRQIMLGILKRNSQLQRTE